MGAGIVIHDHLGTCVAACNNILQSITVPKFVEAHVVSLALSFAREEGLNNLVLTSGCLSVVQCVTGKEMDRSLCR